MKKTIIETTDIVIENHLHIEKRDMNVYHRADKGTHLISCGSSFIVPLRSFDPGDYITLSVAVGPGYMECGNLIDLPSWLNYEFLTEGKLAVKHSGSRTFLNIPAGLPEWKLKLTLSLSHLDLSACRVIVSDNGLDR